VRTIVLVLAATPFMSPRCATLRRLLDPRALLWMNDSSAAAALLAAPATADDVAVFDGFVLLTALRKPMGLACPTESRMAAPPSWTPRTPRRADGRPGFMAVPRASAGGCPGWRERPALPIVMFWWSVVADRADGRAGNSGARPETHAHLPRIESPASRRYRRPLGDQLDGYSAAAAAAHLAPAGRASASTPLWTLIRARPANVLESGDARKPGRMSEVGGAAT